MKRFYIFAVAFLAVGIGSVTAQDLIVLRNGIIIEAKLTEISPTEIRYKRFDNPDGPTIIIPTASVLSIRYENGTSEVVNAAPLPAKGRESLQRESPQNTAMDPNKFIFGINANAGGALSYLWGFGWETGSGPSVSFEFGKGNFNSEINLVIPIEGFGVLATFNGFWPSRIGGAYLGGGIGYSFYTAYDFDYVYKPEYKYDPYSGQYRYYDGYEYEYSWYTAHSLALGLNAGYKFVTKSGFYVRAGAFAGFDFGCLWNADWTMPVYIKPDLAVGWTMR